jgi:hypothetical protein
LLNALAEIAGLSGIVDVEGGTAIDAFAVIAGSEHGERSIPLRRKDHDDIDILAGRESTKSIHFLSREVTCGLLGEVSHLAAYGADLKTVGESPERGPVPRFPGFTEPDDADTQFHNLKASAWPWYVRNHRHPSHLSSTALLG